VAHGLYVHVESCDGWSLTYRDTLSYEQQHG